MLDRTLHVQRNNFGAPTNGTGTSTVAEDDQPLEALGKDPVWFVFGAAHCSDLDVVRRRERICCVPRLSAETRCEAVRGVTIVFIVVSCPN